MKERKIATCFWYDNQAEEAAEFYVTLFPDSEITGVLRPEPNGPALILDFTLQGVPYQALNGGPHFTLSPAASIAILTEDQAETDELWAALTADGGEESQCGWLRDRFGLSWQIVPRTLMEALSSPDRAAAARAQEAMLKMQKIDIATIETAFKGG